MITYNESLKGRILKEKSANKLIKIVSDLWFDKSIELILFRNSLVDKKGSEILNLHSYARDITKLSINISDTLQLAEVIQDNIVAPAKIDIGKLTYEWYQQNKISINDFIKEKLAKIISQKQSRLIPKDVVLYGFGRIGRLLARELIIQEGKGEQLRLRAIVTRGVDEITLRKRASLLRMDSVHGKFPGSVEVDIENSVLIINGHTIHMIAADSPESIDYTNYDIFKALIIDNTGAFRSRDDLALHLKSKGVEKVLLTAPGKEGVPNIVHGVNQCKFNINKHKIYSAASCTTNAITPVLKVIEHNLGIKKGHIETIHAYTNDQNLVDNMHKKYRRGRAAALNMVITETGAGKAVSKALPSLEGKLTSNAIRVPTPNGSLAILNLSIKKVTNSKDLNNIMKQASLNGNLVEQIQYSVSHELVSSDIIGNSCAAIFDSKATIVSGDGRTVVLYVWYDNEYGYTRQVVRLSKHIADVRRFIYY